MSRSEHINTMLPCRQTSSILANKLRYLNLDDTRSASKGLRVLCEKVDFHRTGAYHHHNNRFCNRPLDCQTASAKYYAGLHPAWYVLVPGDQPIPPERTNPDMVLSSSLGKCQVFRVPQIWGEWCRGGPVTLHRSHASGSFASHPPKPGD